MVYLYDKILVTMKYDILEDLGHAKISECTVERKRDFKNCK